MSSFVFYPLLAKINFDSKINIQPAMFEVLSGLYSGMLMALGGKPVTFLSFRNEM
jgi:hypothetical protein